jgi:hypothetical protein
MFERAQSRDKYLKIAQINNERKHKHMLQEITNKFCKRAQTTNVTRLHTQMLLRTFNVSMELP